MIRTEVRLESFGLLVMDKKPRRKLFRQAGAEVAGAARSLVRRAAGAGRLYYGPGGSAAEYRGVTGPEGRPTGFRHRASQSGQAPTRISGTLLKGIVVKVLPSGDGVAIRDKAFYARFVDLGAQGGGRGTGKGKKKSGVRKQARFARVLAARPFLTRAMEQRQADIARRLQAAIETGVAFKAAKPKTRQRSR